jgi:hypothetical protein
LFLFSLVVCLLFILCASNSLFVGQNWVITSVILECVIIKIYQTCTFEVKLMQIVILFLCLVFSYWILLCKVLMRQFDIFMNPEVFKYGF